jgi:hypothetical protein
MVTGIRYTLLAPKVSSLLSFCRPGAPNPTGVSCSRQDRGGGSLISLLLQNGKSELECLRVDVKIEVALNAYKLAPSWSSHCSLLLLARTYDSSRLVVSVGLWCCCGSWQSGRQRSEPLQVSNPPPNRTCMERDYLVGSVGRPVPLVQVEIGLALLFSSYPEIPTVQTETLIAYAYAVIV